MQQQRHVSHEQARWLNLLAEYQYRVVHIPGRTNPADFLTEARFFDGLDPSPHTGYAEPESALKLFMRGFRSWLQAPPLSLLASYTRFRGRDLHGAPSDPVLQPLAAAAATVRARCQCAARRACRAGMAAAL